MGIISDMAACLIKAGYKANFQATSISVGNGIM